MHSITDIINSNVSYQANTWSDITSEVTIEIILNQIKSNQYKSQIEVLRNKLEKGDLEYYDNYKKQLPAVTFSATFNRKRTKGSLKTYNSLLVIDIDKLDAIKLESTYNFLLKEDYVLAFWRSPSNKGYKGLISINYKIENVEIELDTLHKSAFKKLSKYFFDKYSIELDNSGSDLTRLCFLSYDNNLIQKVIFNNFEIADVDIISCPKSSFRKDSKLIFASNRDILYNPLGKNNQLDRKIMTNIIRYLNNKKLSITYNYQDWCKVAMAISNAFTFEIGLNYFAKLSSMDIDKYSEVACTNFLINCFETRKGKVTFRSIVYLANQKGYKTKYQRNGVPKVEG